MHEWLSRALRLAKSALSADTLSPRLRWSSLARIGNTGFARWSFLVPLIGTFILFSDLVIGYLSISPTFYRPNEAGINAEYTVNGLIFTYVGLSIISIASLIFFLRCPSLITEYGSPNDFMMSPTASSVVGSKLNLAYILSAYAAEFDDVDKFSDPPRLSGDISMRFHELMEEMYSDNDGGEESPYSEDVPEVMNAAGYLDFHEFAIYMSSQQRVKWPDTKPFHSLAPKYTQDIAYIAYRMNDQDHFYTRVICGFLYLLGFLVCAIPAIRTFILIAARLF